MADHPQILAKAPKSGRAEQNQPGPHSLLPVDLSWPVRHTGLYLEAQVCGLDTAKQRSHPGIGMGLA